jgi:hypothetical protein
MQQLDLFTTATAKSVDDVNITITPSQYEIMQALVSGDLDRATQLIDLQHDTDLDLQ